MPARDSKHQRGATVVEFALIVLLFFTFLFAVIELARLMFLYNTLQEVTRRAANAASITDPGDPAAMDDLRQRAIFRRSPGGLILMSELTDQAVRIDYMSVNRDATGNYAMQAITSGSMPASPAENRQNCLVDPYGSNCIRLVRVRVCDPHIGGTCEPMKFRPMVSLFNLQLPLPLASTIAKAQSLGLQPD